MNRCGDADLNLKGRIDKIRKPIDFEVTLRVDDEEK